MNMRPIALGVVVLLAASIAVPVTEAWARAGSGGSRGSRSYSAPARPSPSSPTAPSPAQPSSPMASPQRPSPFGGGLMGGIGGFLIGGLIGSMLFGGLGHGMGGFGGIGLIEIVLIGGALFLVFRMFKRRREAEQPAYASAYGAGAGDGSRVATLAPVEMPAGMSELERGIGHIRQMDGAFDPQSVAALARDGFVRLQAALTARDLNPVAERITARMFTDLQAQADRLRAVRQTNRMEQINVRRADVTEAWQEGGQDFVTVYLAGSLVDYTVDDASGGVVDGSKTTPQDFEEFWTFTRGVGPNPWKLSAIQTA
jgi:predicted lipid-binding transport protein (Tim44 family)